MKNKIFSAFFKNNNKEIIFLLLITFASVYKVIIWGFSYTPYLDDYVQYLYFPFFENPLTDILFGGPKTAFSRPFAALSDIYITAPLFSYPPLALVFYTLVHTASGIIFYLLLRKVYPSSAPLFLLFYLFSPTLSEGAYWISASSRLASGMLFSALSAYFIINKNPPLFCLFYILSLGFYEQTAILSFCIVFLIFLTSPKKHLPFFLAAISLFGVLLLYYYIFGKSGNNAERIETIGFSPNNIKSAISSFIEVQKAQIPLYTLGFSRGLKLLLNSPQKLLALNFISALIALFAPVSKDKIKNKKRLFLFSAALFTAPVLPFFILKGAPLNFRNLFPLSLGFSLFLSFFLSLAKRKRATVFLLSLYLLICFQTEVFDYKTTAERDERIIYHIINENKNRGNKLFSIRGKAPSFNVSVVNCTTTEKNKVKPAACRCEEHLVFSYAAPDKNYLPQSSPYLDHIMSITGSDWGLTGACRAVLRYRDIEVQ